MKNKFILLIIFSIYYSCSSTQEKQDAKQVSGSRNMQNEEETRMKLQEEYEKKLAEEKSKLNSEYEQKLKSAEKNAQLNYNAKMEEEYFKNKDRELDFLWASNTLKFKPSKKSTIVQLKDGTVLFGIIRNFKPESVILERAGKLQEILKNDIVRIKFPIKDKVLKSVEP